SSSASVEGVKQSSAHVSFLQGGDPRQWHADVPAFAELRYRELWPGVDARYSAGDTKLKAQFIVAPGTDPSIIRLEYRGAKIRVREDGSLSVEAGESRLIEDPPFAFQETASGRVAVTAKFLKAGEDTAGFELGSYDPSLPLIIDPTITYSTY